MKKLEEKYPWKQDGTPSEVTLDVPMVLDNIGYRHGWSNGQAGRGEPCISALINLVMHEVIPRLQRKGYNASFENSCALVISVRVVQSGESPAPRNQYHHNSPDIGRKTANDRIMSI